MDEPELASRLSEISTRWTLLFQANQGSRTIAQEAQLALFYRYRGAAYRYLLGVVRDPDVADDLSQEFAVRCVKDAFPRADPAEGRFRNYLKTMLMHLIADHRTGQRRRPLPLDSAFQPAAPAADQAESDRLFLESWQKTLLAQAWSALKEAERQGGPRYHSVLKFRAEHKVTSAEMAAQLTAQFQASPPLTEAGVRKTLERARAQFAELLVAEVEHSLGHPTLDELEQELIDLGLVSYCRSALHRRKAARKAPAPKTNTPHEESQS